MKRSKAYAPRKMRNNNKPTQTMQPACKRCHRGTLIVVHEKGEVCPKEPKK